MEQLPEQTTPVNWFRRIATAVAILACGSAGFVGGVIVYVQLSRANVIGWDKTPVEYALVLGASVKQDGTPSDALYDRIATAVELYNDDYVQKLLMTGDDGKFHANEVAVMKRVAMELGVPESDILVDGQGYRTYESCKRAHEVLGIEEAVIVTQRFHLARALYLCGNFMKVSVQGRAADKQSYQRITFFWARDLLSSFKAWWDINVQEPKPPVEESERD
ncbi:YdcF family protein [Candidatus Uhrbacteria bacterium]|nr:YdcF family protein [Candidatus Uhrbacteria bacterium]